MPLKKAALPKTAIMPGASASKTPFDREVTETVTNDPGQWYMVEDGGSPVGASTWARNLNKAVEGADPYEWAKVDTGQKKSIGGGKQAAVVEIYVRYNPAD